MIISTVRIRNFRGIKRLDLELGRTTVLIGENNSGKTSVLDALKFCLRDVGPRGRHPFEGWDFHLADGQSEPSLADPIKIAVTFSEEPEEKWDDTLAARLNRAGILQVDEEGRSRVSLLVTCAYDDESRDFLPEWRFLDLEEKPLERASSQSLTSLRDVLRFYYLNALRDAARHFDPKGPFWRPFLQDSKLSIDRKAEIEAKLQEVNDLVVSSHDSFEQVVEGLRRIQSVVPLASGEAVAIEAVPNRMFDMLAKARVHVGASSGAKIPLDRHGEGTQSLAVLMLFSAFLDSQSEGAAVLALEEPEAHLHPSAIRALGALLGDFSGQKLISTHSGELLAETDVCDIRRLARSSNGVEAFAVGVGDLSPEETRKFNRHIRQSRGELLFARSWLLVEGETESWVYPAAARALGLDLHREGVRLVEFSQSDPGMLAKVANAFGIPWCCVGDDDGEREKVERKLKDLAGAEVAGEFIFPYADIEDCLKRHRYEDVYKRFPGKRGKARAAAEVAQSMEERGEMGVPCEIRQVLEKIVDLARGGCP